MNPQSGQDEKVALIAWDPMRCLREVDPLSVRFSRGFLRCRPEKWFPGFTAHWLPLAHSLGVEIKMVEAKPLLAMPKGCPNGYACTVDDEPLGIFLDEASSAIILEAVCPGASAQASGVVGEYLARRLLSSLVSSWSGPESSVVRFETEMDPFQIHGVGAVKVTIEVNTHHCTIWVVLGKLLADRLDALWRGQIRSASRQAEGEQQVHLEVAQLAVPPAMLVDYLRTGTVIDLEMPMTDMLALRVGGRPWLPARMCRIGNSLGFEVVAGPVSASSLPDGTTRLSIEFGVLSFESSQLLEVGQVGAFWDTGLALSDKVQMAINGEKVAEARLCAFEGRFAITVG